MRLGVITPVVNLNPRFDPPEWETEGGPQDIIEVARAADELGYWWLSCPEHVAVPKAHAAVRGARYYDPLATLSFVAAHTQTIKLLSHVLVLGYHHPIQVAKSYGTLDVLSGGRVILGVGVGSLKEEFELLGAPFDDRGKRADDALAAIRSAFGKREPSHAGPFYTYEGLVVDPCGVQQGVPIWVGGRSSRSLVRALDLADGWVPFGLPLASLRDMLTTGTLADRVKAKRASGFEVVLAPEPPLDPASDRSGALEIADHYAAAGATCLAVRFVHTSRSHYLEQMQAMAELMGDLT